ncbi:unnamed protein product, partial [Laminaria digitata]
WRRLPLDHIFATAARVYRRSRLDPAFLDWRASTAATASRQQHHRHANAATSIQALVRVHLAHRVPERITTRASCTIQRAVRLSQAQRRRVTLTRDSLKRKREERREREKSVEISRLAKKQEIQEKGANAIQAVWRGVVGRTEGGTRARRKLRRVLMDLGGGTGRMHR